MSHNRPIDPSILETPEQPHAPADGHLPVTRAEFRPVRESVRRIEHALIGENYMSPDDTALIGRVKAVEIRVADHDESRKNTRKIAWFAGLASLGMLLKTAYHALTNTHP